MATPTSKRLIEDFGQLFVMAVDGKCVQPEVVEFFQTFRIGGVILFEDNYETPAQLRAMINILQSRCCRPGEPLLIAVDQEGGTVQRFRDGFTPIPAAADLGDGEPTLTEKVYRLAAEELRSVGVNLNLAPVADLCPRDLAGAIGSRSFGPDPYRVSMHVAAAIRGHRSGGILSCAKHFPGHGATTTDSRQALPTIARTFSQMEAKDLIPFRAAVEEGVDVIMTAHAIYSDCADPDTPASLSRYWCRDILRGHLGFNGITISDALEMKALSHLSPADSGAAALSAGTDMLLYYREAHQFAAFASLRERLCQGAFDVNAIEESLQRVRKLRSSIH